MRERLSDFNVMIENGVDLTEGSDCEKLGCNSKASQLTREVIGFSRLSLFCYLLPI